MTREEAIDMCMEVRHYLTSGNPIWDKDKVGEALDMAIEALKRERTDEWCTDCKEYDTEKKCCPRFNKVIREAMKRVPHEDGTLEVKVEDATKVGRVLISDDKHRGGLYYPDEDEPQGDLISREKVIYEIHDCFFNVTDELPRVVDEDGDEVIADVESMTALLALNKELCERINALPSADKPTDGDLISRADAIEAMGEEPPVWCDEEYEIAEHDQWRDDIEAIKSVPSADRPRGEWTLLAEERPVDDYEIIATVYWPGYGDSIIAVGHIDRFDNWHLYSPTEGELIKGFEVIAWKTLPEPYCGADMRGEEE